MSSIEVEHDASGRRRRRRRRARRCRARVEVAERRRRDVLERGDDPGAGRHGLHRGGERAFGREHRTELAADLLEAVGHGDDDLARELIGVAPRRSGTAASQTVARTTRSAAAASALVAGAERGRPGHPTRRAARRRRPARRVAVPRPEHDVVPDAREAGRDAPPRRPRPPQHPDPASRELRTRTLPAPRRGRGRRAIRRCSRRRGGRGARRRGRCRRRRGSRRRGAAPSSSPGSRGARTPGCRPGARRAMSLSRHDLGVGQPVEPHLDPHRRPAVEHELGPGDLHRDDLRRVVAHVDPALHARRSRRRRAGGRSCAIVFGNTITSSAAPRSSSTNVRHEVAALGVLAVQRGDDAADGRASRPRARRAARRACSRRSRRSARSAPISGCSLT